MIALMINGKSHSVDVPTDMPLQWVLRDVIGEPATACLAPDVANAVYSATRKRIRQLPLQPALVTVT